MVSGRPGRSRIWDAVGETPLLRLARIGRDHPEVEFLAKAEWFNPGGSVKDRPALYMIRDAEAQGRLGKGKRLLDATSGNTGIALAMMGAAMGYGVTLAIPANAGAERKAILRALGAELLLTDPLEGTDGSQREAKALVDREPDAYVYLDQYNNPANVRAHYETTGPEILRQTGGALTHFVAGLGTAGTVMGAGQRLREHDPRVRVVAVEPAEPLHGIEGLKHMATAVKPGIYDPSFPDERIFVPTELAQETARRLAREEGLLVGTSSGAAMAAALRLAEGLDEGRLVVVFPDGGDKYLHDPYWEEEG
jgi:cysteine synthase B